MILAFLGVSALVIVVPGPDTAVTVSATLAGGRRNGLFTAFGVATGQVIWTFATSIGLAALLVASEPAFMVLKYLGAAYLFFLGGQALWSALRRTHVSEAQDTVPAGESARKRSSSAYFRRGLLSDLSSPKMAAFFTSLLPQFGSGFSELMMLGLAFAAMTFGWLACYALLVSGLGDLFKRSRVRRALDAATGAVLIALGVRIAVEPR